MDSVKSMIQKYGLWHKKEKTLLRFSSSSNAGKDCCGDRTIELNTYGDNEWLVDNSYNAAYVRQFSTPWYNAGHSSPMHGYESEELEVVRIVVKVDNEEQHDSIPTIRELVTEIYKDSNPDHLKNLLEKLDAGMEITYSLYDLERFIENRKRKAKEKYEARSKKPTTP